MDPLADKILMCSAFVVLCAENLIPAWVVVVILAREFLVTGHPTRRDLTGAVLAADKLGKLKTVFQISTLIYFLLFLASMATPLGFFAPLFGWKWFGPAIFGGRSSRCPSSPPWYRG